MRDSDWLRLNCGMCIPRYRAKQIVADARRMCRRVSGVKLRKANDAMWKAHQAFDRARHQFEARCKEVVPEAEPSADDVAVYFATDGEKETLKGTGL